MAAGPDLIQVAVPSLAGITTVNYRFLTEGHDVEEVAVGPEGEVPVAMDDWIMGLPPVEDGIEYRKEPRYAGSRGLDATFPHQIVVQPVATTLSVAAGQPALAAPMKQIDWVPSGGSINTYLIGEGRYVHRLTGSNEWTSVFDAGAGFETKDIIGANSFLELGLGPTRLAQESSTGATWATLAIYADRWAALNDQLWRAVRPYSAYNTLFSASPYAWSSAYILGDSSYDINSITGLEQLLMIGKEDGVFSLDEDGLTVPFTPELRAQAHEDMASIRGVTTFNNDYYFRTLNGLIKIDADAGLKHRVGLDTVASPDLPTVRVRGVCADDRFAYAILDNSSANGLMIVRRSIQGAWHPWYWDPAAGRAAHIAFSGALGYPSIFFSYYNGATYVTKFIRTSTFPNPLDDTNYRYDTGASFYLRFPRIGSSEVRMLIDRILVQSLDCAAGRTIQFQVSVDGGAWENFGSAITSSPRTSVTATTPFTGTYFDFRAVLTTNVGTATPVLKGFGIKGVLRPDRRRIHTFKVLAQRGAETSRHGNVARAANTVLDDLYALRGTDVYATVKDESGREFQGVVIDVRRTAGKRGTDHTTPHLATLVVAEKMA